MTTRYQGTRAATLSSARRASARLRRNPLEETPRREVQHPNPILTFEGGAGTSTGGRYLVEAPGCRVLVDCGMFAGSASLRRRNWSPAPRELHAIDAVILTSADLEHCGFLPQLVAEGWAGPVFATHGTTALVPIALTDAAQLFAEEAAAANCGGWSKHTPALPPFRVDDAERAAALLRPVDFGAVEEFEGGSLEFGRGGRLLGSAWARLRIGDRTVVFGSRLGGANHPLLQPPDPRPDCDVLVLGPGRTLGDNIGHGAGRLAAAVHRAVKRGGSVLVPASAVGQTEVLLTMLRDLMDAQEIPQLPVHLDSPAGLSAVEAYQRAESERWPDIRTDGLGRIRLPELVSALSDQPSIVIAGPETAGPGRVLGHLARLLPDPRNAVLPAGYQVPGTRAAALASGVRQLKIRGRYVPVRAEITRLDGLGELADEPGVHDWALAGSPPDTTYVVEGEPEPSQALAKLLHAEGGWCAVVPADGERVLL